MCPVESASESYRSFASVLDGMVHIQRSSCSWGAVGFVWKEVGSLLTCLLFNHRPTEILETAVTRTDGDDEPLFGYALVRQGG